MRIVTTPILVCFALFAAACSDAPPEPVARLAIGPDRSELPYGETASLQITFSPLVDRAELGPSPTVFIHLIAEPDRIVRTFDHILRTDGWRVGDDLRYEHEIYQSMLSPPIEPGTYLVRAGLYEAGGGRYGLLSGAEEVRAGEFAFGEVVVPEGTSGPVSVEYRGDWQLPEPTPDLQIVTQRWLGDGGGLTVGPVTRPTRALLRLNLIDRIVNSDRSGSGEAHLEIASTCSADSELSSTGVHYVDLVLQPPAEGEHCDIDFSAATLYTDRDDEGMHRSVLLELLTFNEL